MARNIITGIDIGTYQVKIIVAEYNKKENNKLPNTIGAGFAESRGLRHGYIINSNDVVKSIRSAVEQAEKGAKMRIKHAYLSIGGVGLEEVKSKGEVIISRADGEITDLDVKKTLEDSEEKVGAKISDRKSVV